ncbi:hypothetical protein AAG747_08650 [Rapidithrix thailandica]|uniref:Uncharacterized protein n=1 Tax=Rapidithrix thailandica TaxID=413964 RepID=A0AAW9SAP6_9BACT
MKKLTILIVLMTHAFWSLGQPQNRIPENYQLVYSNDFRKAKKSDFYFTDETAWRLTKVGENRVLALVGQSDYQPKVRSPFNIALIKDLLLGDFVMEVELCQTGKEYGHRDLCLFFNVKDPSDFYYVHLATKPDPHAHNIFLVNDEPRVAIGKKVSGGVDWGTTTEWHKVRIERNVKEGTIKVYFGDMDHPVMETVDTHFDQGRIGFGSFDDTGMVDNVKVWAPKQLEKSETFFD